MHPMKVRLTSITAGVDGPVATESLILYCAKVSNPNAQDSGDTKLLKYLITNNHWSPFEMASMCLEIETSRAISAQILRHRSFSFQEFSQRYADPSVLGEIEYYKARRQDLKDRQNSIDDMAQDDQCWWFWAQKENSARALGIYEEAIARGIAKEQARFILPMATKTRLYMNGTVRSWIHYFQVRAFDKAGKTQKEHKDIALAGFDIFQKYFPVTAAAIL